ncbi:MAG: EAL domain-containing protein [Actinomycetota bacterium]|nr:EAL domain-containing protein [Actinomycetota bacterium]
MPVRAQPWASRAFDHSVLGLAVVLVAATVFATLPSPDVGGMHPALLLAVPVIVLVSWYPVLLQRARGVIEIGFDSCVLAFLGTLVPAHQGAVIWALGALVAQMCTARRPAAKIFNVGVMTASGIVALWVIDWLSPAGSPVHLQQLVAVLVGCTVYFVLDFIISEISVVLEDGTGWGAELGRSDVFLSMVSIVAVDSMGYLAALVLVGVSPWATLLLAVPVATLLVASMSTTRDRERSRRMRVLFDVSRSMQRQSSADGVLSLLESGGRALMQAQPCVVRADPPTHSEVGVRVTDSSHNWWLVAPVGQRDDAAVAAQKEHLDQLGLAGSEALSRLKLTREMTFLARHDTLTELWNRSVFLSRVEQGLDRSRHPRSRIAVLFCDLDGFKQINDRFGHSAGDALLVQTAARIHSCVSDQDTVARLGGDEFAVLLEHVADREQIERVADRLLGAVATALQVNGHGVSVSTSIGIATSDGAGSSEELLRNADIAMYEAKAQGKNRFVHYRAEYGSARVRKLEMADALSTAIEGDELSVVYQPVYSVRTGAMTGLEALTRWRHDGTQVCPDTFIPLAEETGLVVPLGARVLDQVARDAARIRALDIPPLQMAVNISAQQLLSADFVDRVRSTSAALGPMQLLLEVTERDVVREDSLSKEVMSRLVSEGVQFAVDDFGVGFSSVGYLQTLPVQVLKTDRTFVDGIEDSVRAANLLQAMLLMGRALGLRVVVEGVEQQTQLDHLRTMRNEVFVQGFLLAPPMPVPAVLDLLAVGRPLPGSERDPATVG